MVQAADGPPQAAVPLLALTQGDPAGIGPEILVKLLAAAPAAAPSWRPLLVAERVALRALDGVVGGDWRERLLFFDGIPSRGVLDSLPAGMLAVVDPVGEARRVELGRSRAADAGGAMAALDLGIEATRSGVADALVTGPLSKASVARHHRPDFRGHTGYLAAACGLERYGRDYLMAFLSPDLQVALLTTHLPLTEALAAVDRPSVEAALALLDREAGGRIAVAGLNPHAGEGGLMGAEEAELLEPAVAAARRGGVDVRGPESADSLFARSRRGEFDWVLALYHDQGLIAVKTAAFGRATNWTLGLPFLRTSVDHGTGFDLAGQGVADAGPLTAVIDSTLGLLAGELPRGRKARR